MYNDLSDERKKLLEAHFIEAYGALYTTALANLYRPDLAEDAVQEVFLKALRFQDSFFSSPNPVGWLFLALRNVIRRYYSDRAILEKYLEKYSHTIDAYYEDEGSVELEYTRILEDDDLRLLIEIYCQGNSYDRAAEKRGISAGACKMRVKRAKEKMRKYLSGDT